MALRAAALISTFCLSKLNRSVISEEGILYRGINQVRDIRVRRHRAGFLEPSFASDVIGKVFENVAKVPCGWKGASKLGLNSGKAIIPIICDPVLQKAEDISYSAQDGMNIDGLLHPQEITGFDL